jgi:hypothetical protein
MKATIVQIGKAFRHHQSKVIALLLALLGFSTACHKASDSPVEYGSPHADFLLNGSIKSALTGNPIGNIQLIMERDTALTNSNGTFSLKVTDFPITHSYLVKISDIDGIANGSYAEKDTTVTFPGVNYTNGDGSWYKGEETLSVNVSLEPTNK